MCYNTVDLSEGGHIEEWEFVYGISLSQPGRDGGSSASGWDRHAASRRGRRLRAAGSAWERRPSPAALRAGLAAADRVTSPTFTRRQRVSRAASPCFTSICTVSSSADELFDIGWDDYLDARRRVRRGVERERRRTPCRRTPCASRSSARRGDDDCRRITITGGEARL